jgi:tetratricopeptide (TPR) repeat protein
MTPENKRLQMLEKMTASGQADAFAWYALALEYRREDRTDDALRTFERLRADHADYLPMYLMAGQMLAESDRNDDARGWLEQGIQLAREQGNGKALGELEAALEDCAGG